MGGLISFYIAWKYADKISMAGCLSPAFSFDKSILKLVRESEKTPEIKLAIFNGTKDLDAQLQHGVEAMLGRLNEVDFPDDKLYYKLFTGQSHNEEAWSFQVTYVLKYFSPFYKLGETDIKYLGYIGY